MATMPVPTRMTIAAGILSKLVPPNVKCNDHNEQTPSAKRKPPGNCMRAVNVGNKVQFGTRIVGKSVVDVGDKRDDFGNEKSDAGSNEVDWPPEFTPCHSFFSDSKTL